MVENIFAMKIASEFQRHELSLSSLELRHSQRLEHVQLDLDPVYLLFKRMLVEIFGQTEEYQLLQACDLGDCKPTEMRKMLGAKGSTVLLKKLFMDRLPSNVRRVLLAGPMDNLNDLKRRADRVVAEGCQQ